MKTTKLLLATIAFATLNFLNVNCQAQYTKLLDFNGVNGNNPYGDLYYDGTYLYGMTSGFSSYTGTNTTNGNIFKIKPDGSGSNTLLKFSGSVSNYNNANGQNPYGSLISDGTYLYGMTKYGDTYNDGVIFRIKPDGTGDTVLFNFNNFITGGEPTGSLYYDGTYLYGTAQFGPSYNSLGVIFRIKPNGTGDTILYNFLGSPSAQIPVGTMVSDGTYLYGMTNQGGPSANCSYGCGTIYKIKKDGTSFDTLMSFNGNNGVSPVYGSLLYEGGILYGMTEGGNYSFGNIFKIKTDGTGDSVLYSFNGTNGKYPYGSLISDGTYLYGMTYEGGTTGYGTIFKVKLNGTGYVDLYDFSNTGSNGYSPYGSLVASGSFLYGMTSKGGTKDSGTVFKYQYLPCTTVSHTQSPIVCYPQTSLVVGSHTYTVNGTYTDTITQKVSGCDSIITTHLTILPPNTTTQTITKCAGQSLTVGTHTLTASGTSTYTLTSYQGCDSVVTTHLIIPPTIFSQTVTCGQSLTVGTHTLTTSGTTTYTLTSYYGCDSIVTTYLTIAPGNTGCTTVTGITEYNLPTINVYPNPTSGIVNLNLGQTENAQVSVYNVLGEIIYQHTITSSIFDIDLSAQPNGIYFIKLITEQGTVNKSLVISK